MHNGRKALLVVSQSLALGVFLSPAFAVDTANDKYLALGDSITYGLDPRLLPPISNTLPNPSQFVGYPEVIASIDSRFKNQVDASCPGETSGSFLYGTRDNGCNDRGPTGQGPFRPAIDLHTNYPLTQTQYNFAISQLEANKHIKLVTLNIGANDALLVVGDCVVAQGDVGGCIATNLPGAIATYGRNLATILGGIRSKYSGTLVVLNAYAPPGFDDIALALNHATAEVASNFRDVKVADAYGAFNLISTLKHVDVCEAGLLIRLAPDAKTCDQHPSELGQNVLAASIEVAIGR